MKKKMEAAVFAFVGLIANSMAFGQSYCSGIAISKEYVLTSYIAIGNTRSVQLRFCDSDWQEAQFVDGDETDDWCILRLSNCVTTYGCIDCTYEPETGDKVYSFGFGNAEPVLSSISFCDGSITGLSDSGSLAAIAKNSLMLDRGFIGAPLFSDDNNSVIGVIRSDARGGRKISDATLLMKIRTRIAGHVGGLEKLVANRRANKRAVCMIRCNGSAMFSNGKVASRDSRNDTNTETFQKSKSSVAIVEGKQGVGTGFLCEMDGKKYFVTNKHVANQRGKIKAYFSDGKTIEFSPKSIIDVATNRDLVRFEVSDSHPPLKLATESPEIGDKIEFYGNAVGGKVVTVTTGKILAVGPDMIEIDSQIQGGNSGSPLVRTTDGEVIGVTTMSRFNKIDHDASKVGTRYDPNVKLTREFAVRFTEVKWMSKSYAEFLKGVNTYEDLRWFVQWMYDVCLKDNQVAVLEYRRPDRKFVGATFLNDQVLKLTKCDEAEKKAWDRLKMMLEKNRTGSTMQKYGQMELDGAIKTVKDRMVASYKTRGEVLKNTLQRAKGTKLLTGDEKEEIVEELDWQVRRYHEKFRMQLKGLALPGFSGNNN